MWLSQTVPDLSRSKIQKLLEKGLVLVNKRQVKPSYKLEDGDIVELTYQKSETSEYLHPQKMDLDLLYEDDHVIVINKTSGLIMHPGAGEHGPTLVEGLLYHLGNRDSTKVVDTVRPGIVHRLDKDTSGVVVCAKDDISHAFLAKQFEQKTNKRIYVALLDGLLTEVQEVENYLYRDPHHRQRFTFIKKEDFAEKFESVNDNSKKKRYRWSKSRFMPQTSFGQRISLVKIKLFTGRTHQIRVHSKSLNAPVLGDPLYGVIRDLPRVFPRQVQRAAHAIKRQMLHAESLGFIHPKTKEELEFSAPIPKDFRSVLDILEPWNDQHVEDL